MIRVDIFVFGHWSLVVYFGIQDCKYWNMFTYVEFDYIVLQILVHVTRVGLLITGKIPFSNAKLKKFLTGLLEA